ncbi:uncharacterized protein [Battus philenor]|uniref:uncharacterized protein n=1 Tax=Battus philenor TaxID=42288 RepID=UPI0035CF6AD8
MGSMRQGVLHSDQHQWFQSHRLTPETLDGKSPPPGASARCERFAVLLLLFSFDGGVGVRVGVGVLDVLLATTSWVLWVCITGAAIWEVAEVSLGQLQRYNENPTVVTLEKDFRSWRFSLPGITICEKDRVNPDKLADAIERRWHVGPEDEKYSYYSRFVSTVANSDLFHLDGYQEFRDDEQLNVDLFQLALEVMPEHQVKTTWSVDVDAKWTPVMTEAGVCYVTNSVAIADVAIGIINSSMDLPLSCKYSSLSCYVMFESLKPMDIYVHSPYDIMELTTLVSQTFPTLNRVTELSLMETRTGRDVRSLRPNRRRCLYNDEPNSDGRQVYSTNTCRLTCRIKRAIQLCGCRPFYYFYAEGKPCDTAAMWCLATHSQELTNFGGVKCPCSQHCVDAIFREISTVDQLWDRGPFQNRAAVRFTVQAPRTRYTREIVFHFEDLVVSFGGAAGLFLGASFISLMEILYFFLEKIITSFFPRKTLQVTLTEESRPRFEATRIHELTSVLEERSIYRDYRKNMFSSK